MAEGLRRAQSSRFGRADYADHYFRSTRVEPGPGGQSLGSLTRQPELNLLNVLKRDEARYPILCVDDHKGRDGRINFLRNGRKVNEVRMIDRKTTARAGNDNKRRKRIRPDNIRNLFSGHERDTRRKSANSKQIILLL
jgi:hypothetical protein